MTKRQMQVQIFVLYFFVCENSEMDIVPHRGLKSKTNVQFRDWVSESNYLYISNYPT